MRRRVSKELDFRNLEIDIGISREKSGSGAEELTCSIVGVYEAQERGKLKDVLHHLRWEATLVSIFKSTRHDQSGESLTKKRKKMTGPDPS